MEKLSPALLAAAAVAGLALGASPVQASLILVGPENFQGTGLRAVNTILTIQSPSTSTIETGSVLFNGATDVRTSNAKTLLVQQCLPFN